MGIEFDPRAYLAKQPEQIFSVPTLIHTSAEISSIIEHFTQAEQRSSYESVIVLLVATKKFRMDTAMTGHFARQPGDVKGLDGVFKNMEAALQQAELERKELAGIDADIILSAIRYSRASIINRVHSRTTDLAFAAYWDKSNLKKMVTAVSVE